MRQNVEIAVYTPETLPLEAMGRESGEAVRGLLAHKGIEFHPEMKLASVDPGRRELTFDDGSFTPFHLLVTVPEHRAPAVVREAGLLDETGWVSVSPRTLETRQENVFALGDLIYLHGPHGQALPKTGLLAERQAASIARTIAHRIGGGDVPPPFAADNRTLLEVGGGAAALFQGDYLSREAGFEMKQPSIVWHMARLALERYWLARTY
jgi:sulfide:quinone oxidoreductase